jgi:hypothetical protein
LALSISHAAFESKLLSEKIEEQSGRTTKQFEGLQERLSNIAADLRALYEVRLPGGWTSLSLMLQFGAPGQGGLCPIDPQENSQTVRELAKLPDLLDLCASSLEHWPHPLYRALASDRRWKAYFLVCLCAYVNVNTGKPHWAKIATLLNSADRFLNAKRKVVGRNVARGPKLVESDAMSFGTDGERVRKAFEGFQESNPDGWATVSRKMEIIKHRSRKKSELKTSQTESISIPS